jgi:hypothetical protein
MTQSGTTTMNENLFSNILEKIHSIPSINNDELFIVSEVSELLPCLAFSPTKNISSAFVTKRLSRNNRISIDRCSDLFHTIKIKHLLSLKIKSSTLYVGVQIPKSPDIKQTYIETIIQNGFCIDNEEWKYNEEHYEMVYIPIKKINFDTNGNDITTFSFFEKPIPIVMFPYEIFSIGFEFEKSDFGINNHPISICHSMVSPELRMEIGGQRKEIIETLYKGLFQNNFLKNKEQEVL